MKDSLQRIAEEANLIREDLPKRFLQKDTKITDFDVHMFGQTWGSTALGFPGCGGQMMTRANTWVFIPELDGEDCLVYFGGSFAYAVPWSRVFQTDVLNGHMVSVRERGKYLRTADIKTKKNEKEV